MIDRIDPFIERIRFRVKTIPMSLITKGQSCAMVCQYTATRCLGSFKATRAQVVVRLAFSSMTNNSTGSSRKIHSIQPAIHSIRKCDQTILKIRSIGSHTKRSHKHHSTSTMDFVHSYPSVIVTDPHNIPRPSSSALRTLFIASAVPMVGFGCMDNFVMIQAGQYIDSTLGVQLGLATMAAAAAGTNEPYHDNNKKRYKLVDTKMINTFTID